MVVNRKKGNAEEQAYDVERVSVITVCLNALSTVKATMSSVRKQRYPSIEHVLVDGMSTDGTVEVIKAHNPDIFISEPDDGLYYAMQKGALAATGDVVFFLNSGDTFYDDDVVSDVVSFFNMTGSDAVFGNLFPCYLAPGDVHDHDAFHDQKLLDLSYFNNRRLFFDESIHHQTIFYRREIFDHCSFICEQAAANGEYHLNMCAFVDHGCEVKHIPRPICRFALGGKSTSNFDEEWRRYSLARDILRKMYFPRGPNIKIANEYEYLFYPPSFKARFKIIIRRYRLLGVARKMRHLYMRCLGCFS